ncbi:hypothetical protein [Streptomyces sp. NPDC054887]
MTAPTVETVISPVLSLPVVSGPAAALLLAGMDLVPRTTVPAWITDPELRAGIVAALMDIPDGGA